MPLSIGPHSSLARRVWLLNLEAEHELSHGPGFIPSAKLLARVAGFVPQATGLLAPGDSSLGSFDLVSPPAASHPCEAWTEARCWLPTPFALRQLKQLGVPRPPAPPLAVLQRANHRRFTLEMGGGAPGAHFVATEPELQALLLRTRNQRWLCKRPFGTAGRDQRRLDAGVQDLAARQWLEASLRHGGLLAEQWVSVVDEFCQHGMLAPNGELTMGSICHQTVSPQRAWTATQLATPAQLSKSWQSSLQATVQRVAQGLHTLGYFGPFGVDAYSYLASDGTLAFNCLSEVNARYSMGFATGFAATPNWRQLPGA